MKFLSLKSHVILLLAAFSIMQSLCAQVSPNPVPRMSMVSLIVEPSKYEAKMVSFDGFLSVGFEKDAIFLSEADRKYKVFPNSIRLVLSKKESEELLKYDGMFCRVSGLFQVDSPGFLSPGSLSNPIVTPLFSEK